MDLPVLLYACPCATSNRDVYGGTPHDVTKTIFQQLACADWAAESVSGTFSFTRTFKLQLRAV